MRDYLILDTSRYPIVIGTYEGFLPTAAEFSKWQADIDAFNADKENHVFILDFSKVQNLPTEYRFMAAQWAKKNDDFFLKRNIKAIFYTPSLTLRLMMKAILVMTRLRSTCVLASSMEKALARAKKELSLNTSVTRGQGEQKFELHGK